MYIKNTIVFATITFLFLMSTKNLLGQQKLSVDEFEEKMNTLPNATIVDVRTPEEYQSRHLKNALNIDWNSNSFQERVLTLDKSAPIFVYCLSGGRSSSAVAKMHVLGFKTIYEMKGGIMAWNNAGKKTESNSTNVIEEISPAQYNTLVNSKQFVLIDFNAPWCAPCRKMAPMLEEFAQEKKEFVSLVKINADEEKKLAKRLNVVEIPTLLFYKDGKMIWRKTGLTEKEELLKVLESNR